ncbi:SAV_915 family protein [Spirillospora sp. CA-294931]|uniref:SAV_915 family protein n=1 Tax=Spirillospora sp. CA-294931 TaxID=3240042 RepID=UPI003D9127DE
MSELLIVPVRVCGGAAVLRTGRLDSGGERCGIAFTARDRLRAVLGPEQPWIEMAEPALRSTLRQMGIGRIRVDPMLVSPRPLMPALSA